MREVSRLHTGGSKNIIFITVSAVECKDRQPKTVKKIHQNLPNLTILSSKI